VELGRLSTHAASVRVLVLNPGSSSLKASLVDQPGDRTVAALERQWGSDATRRPDRAEDVRAVIRDLADDGRGVDAVGYRVVHGGSRFTQPTMVDAGVMGAVRDLDVLARLHNAVAADVIDAARSALPKAPHVACFDTAFHATLPEASWRYPVPERWSAEWGIRRYGFHGLSVTWSIERAAGLIGKRAEALQLVVAHLGSGCSATAVANGRSVDTTMGMTPLEGLMMGTRSGSIDPGVLLHVLRSGGMSVDDVDDAITHRAGLVAIAGTSDVRVLEKSASDGDPRAVLALEMFVLRASGWIAAMATALGRLDGLVFTGGIGEHSNAIRERICRRLAVLGVTSPAAPRTDDDALLSGSEIPAVLRVRAREDLVISRQVASTVA
jgi:acetate kinase